MARELCSNPYNLEPHPHGGESKSYSYCLSCSQRKQRENYRKRMAKSGRIVVPYKDDEADAAKERADHIKEHRHLAGTCELCNQHDNEGLIQIDRMIGDPDGWDGVQLDPWKLVCHGCIDLFELLGRKNATWSHVIKVATTLAQHKTKPEQVILQDEWRGATLDEATTDKDADE